MRFYQGGRPAVIWNPETKKPDVEFNQGVFETEDERLIELLRSKGYLTQMEQEKLVALGTVPHGGFEGQGPTVEGAATAAPHAVPKVEDVIIEDEEEPPPVLKRERKTAKPKRELKRKK